MGAKKLAVLDVGSDVITLAMQDSRYHDNLLFKASAEYEGYQDGKFLDLENLYNAVVGLVKKYKDTTFCELKELIVGVPAEFTTVICKTVHSDYSQPHKITQRDIDMLFEQGNTYGSNPDYFALNCSPVYYVLDNGKRTPEAPVGQITKGLASFASYVLGEKYYQEVFDAFGQALGIKFLYTSSLLAELMFAIPIEARDEGIILVDSGYISTGVAYAKGDGILYSRAFSLGSGNVAGDIAICLEIPFEIALELTKKLNLNLEPEAGDVYTLTHGGETYNFNIRDINEIAACRVQDIAEQIKRVIESSTYEIPENTRILLTGSGLTIGGAREIVEKVTGHRASYNVSEAILNLNKPGNCSLVGLLLYQRSKLPYKAESKLNQWIKKLHAWTSGRKK
jgi:cell division ATPase FtsA